MGRELLLADRIYYVRTDGSDSNDGLSDSVTGAFKSWQYAVDVAAGLDFNHRAVTIQHGVEATPKTFLETTTVPALTGGGSLKLNGSLLPGHTLFNVLGADVFFLDGTIQSVFFSNMTLAGGGSGLINVAYNSRALIHQGVVFGPANFAQVYVHDAQAQALLLNASYRISGGASYHIFVNGGMLFHEYAQVALENSPSFPGGFMATTNGGKIQTIGSTFAGAATGPRFSAIANGVVNAYGSGPTTLPGSQAGYTASGGQYL